MLRFKSRSGHLYVRIYAIVLLNVKAISLNCSTRLMYDVILKVETVNTLMWCHKFYNPPPNSVKSCHKKLNPLPPLMRDVIYEWPLRDLACLYCKVSIDTMVKTSLALSFRRSDLDPILPQEAHLQRDHIAAVSRTFLWRRKSCWRRTWTWSRRWPRPDLRDDWPRIEDQATAQNWKLRINRKE